MKRNKSGNMNWVLEVSQVTCAKIIYLSGCLRPKPNLSYSNLRFFVSSSLAHFQALGFFPISDNLSCLGKGVCSDIGVSMAIKSYEMLAEEYLLSDHVVPYTSMLFGILACKLVYHVNHLLSAAYFKGYSGLSRMKRIEWNNRAISTLHAIFITAMSLYLVFWSNLYSDYSDNQHKPIVTFQSSLMSTFVLGVSVGYFLSDLVMIIWFYPALGGLEYVIHHFLSITSVAYAMLTGEGQLYTYMVLISETTTPGINLRWYLDTAGMKRTKTYMINGVVIFIAWLVARILLFMFLFYHLYLHYEQVKQMHAVGQFLAFGVPPMLAVMNLMWFGKILRGLKKTLAKRQ